MANTTISPNMNLTIPTTSVDPGPDWANNVNASLTAIDSHNHTIGQGVPIPSAGILINADLPFNGFNATLLRTVRFSPQGAVLTSPDLGAIYVVNADLYYNDTNGNQVRITQGGNVTGSSGTITGLPSGTASASYAAGTFTFNSATNTKATMSVGPVAIGSTALNGNQVTLSAPTSLASPYSMILPSAQGGANNVLVNDGSGNLSWQPIGSSLSVVAGASLTSGSYVPVTSQALTAGTWLINCGLHLTVANSTIFELALSTTSGSNAGAVDGLTLFEGYFTSSPSGVGSLYVPGYVAIVGSTTTYYLNVFCSSAGNSAVGSITAVRIK